MRNKFRLALVLGIGITSLAFAFDASAATYSERTEWAGRDVSYYSGDGGDGSLGYHRSISGATWYYYEINKDTKYSDDDMLYVPFNSDAKYTNKVGVPAKTCQSYGGFWALMRNEYRKTGESAGTLTGRPAAATPLSSIYVGSFIGTSNHIDYKDMTGSPDDKDGSGVEATKFGTWRDVYAYFNNLKDTTAVPSGMSWTPTSGLTYFCAGPEPSSIPDATVQFNSFATVSMNEEYTSAPVINGTSYLSGRSHSFVVPTGSQVTLTFRYYIAKSTESELTPGGQAISYSISGSAGSSSGSIPVSSLTERFHIGSTDYYAGYIEEKHTVTVNSFTSICQTATINGTDSQVYNLATNKLQNGGSSHRSRACIALRPVSNSGEVVKSCNNDKDGGGVFVDNELLGNTTAVVGVSKNGSEEFEYTASISTEKYGFAPVNDTVAVYTKPGDTVQFSYALCFGAHKVKYSKSNGEIIHVTYRSDEPDGNYPNNPLYNSFTVEAGRRGSNSEFAPGFLFGRANALLGRKIYIHPYYARNNELQGGKALMIDGGYDTTVPTSENRYFTVDTIQDSLGDVSQQLRFASPDDKSKTAGSGGIYDCAFYSNLQLGRVAGTGTYQIPGFQVPPKDCISASIKKSEADSNPMSSLVGATLSQTLEYQDITVWRYCLLKTEGPFYVNGSDTEIARYDRIYNNADYRIPSTATRPVMDGDEEKMETYIETLAYKYEKCFGDDNAGSSDYYRAGMEYFYEAYEAYKQGYREANQDRTGRDEIYRTSGASKVSKTAQVVTPYNFDTNVTAEINNIDRGYVYPGETINISADVDILPRVNPLTSSNDTPYATITPPDTKVQLIQFLIRDDVDINSDYSYTYNDGLTTGTATIKQILNGEVSFRNRGSNQLTPYAKASICNMYIGFLRDQLGECTATTLIGDGADDDNTSVGNPDSNPEGQMDYYHAEGNQLSRVVPDVEAGYKYCVAVGINHGDSHGVPGQDLSDDPKAANYAANSFSVNQYLNTRVKSKWKVSKVSCRTVVKKPNFQVWNSGVYSAGDINSSISKTRVNTKITSNLLSGNSDYLATNPSYFGSWAEYFVVSKGAVRGFASASALGYNDPFSDGQHFAARGVGGKGNNFCVLSHTTIANIKCNTEGTSGGYDSGNKTDDSTALQRIRNNIFTAYTDDSVTGIQYDAWSTFDNQGRDWSNDNLNGAKYLKVNYPTFTIDRPINNTNDGTIVIEVKGHLFINQNICLNTTDESTCQNESANYDEYTQDVNNLSLAQRNGATITAPGSLSNLPQIILIADDISIGSDVTQIDAWLITRSNDSNNLATNYVNTCTEFKNGSTTTDTCWKTLKINGPVMTTALLLNRTGGAWPGFSGDVGNPAYDALRKRMSDYVEDQINNYSNKPEYAEANEICRVSAEPQACRRRKIKEIAEKAFLNVVLRDASEAEKLAYLNAGNFSANKSTVSANNSGSRDLTCDGAITPAEIFDLHPFTFLWAYSQSLDAKQANITYAQELAPRY